MIPSYLILGGAVLCLPNGRVYEYAIATTDIFSLDLFGHDSWEHYDVCVFNTFFLMRGEPIHK